MPPNSYEPPKKPWQFSLRRLFLATTLVAMGLAVEVAAAQAMFSPPLYATAHRTIVIFVGVLFGGAFLGGGIGAVVGTKKAILSGFGWGFLFFVAIIFLSPLFFPLR